MTKGGKRRLNSLHIGGAVMLVIGIIALVLGLNVRNKYNDMRDLSELTLADIHEGMYIKGSINKVVSGFPIGQKSELDNGYDTVPFDLYTTESQDTEEDANVSYVLAEVGQSGSGEYICLAVDEFKYTDLYWHIFGGDMKNQAFDDRYFEFEGVVSTTDFEKKFISDKVESWNEDYSYLVLGHDVAGSVDADHVSDCCLRLGDMSKKQYYWLFSVPPLVAGVLLTVLGFRSSDAEEETVKAQKKSKK